MKRREEIQWEAGGIVNRMIERGVSENYDTYYQAFQEGAKWADKTMIEKACNWIKANMPNYINFGEGFIYEVDMADDLRKYLEE